jgi:arylsulfatase A-like enzyme
MATSALAFTAAFVSSRPNLIQIVADDLGYNDLGAMNGNKTSTPHIDGHIRDGIFLSNFYAWRVCAPSRASAMSGRYPWGVGFYDMSNDKHHCIHPSFKLLPAVLKEQGGYVTHAIGKWDAGFVEQHCTPTFRGFDTFLGYYSPCTSDYWYHGAPGGNLTYDTCGGIDFHDSTAGRIHGAAMSGPASLNNTYDQEVFTRRAVEIIAAHDAASAPLYLYLAYHNVHDACEKDRFARGLAAPMATVNCYSTTELDTWKVQAAMTTELDYGVGNVTAALRAHDLWNNTLLMFWSDNGGPLDHSSNFPLRAGKGSEFEGGYRVAAFVSGPVLPPAVRGGTYDGLGHVSDWYVTLMDVGGVAQFDGDLMMTGPRPPDGANLWPVLSGRNRTHPRTEVILAVTNAHFNSSELCNPCPSALRVGSWKLILGVSCDNKKIWQRWPTPGSTSVPFGQSGGTLEAGTDHARAPLLGHTADASPDDDVDDGSHKGSRECLFNLESDPSERHNLASDPSHASKLAELKSILQARAATGPPLSIAFADVGPVNATVDAATCEQERETGFLEPVDWQRIP